MLGSITGGPVAERLISKYNLKSTATEAQTIEKAETFPLIERKFFDSVLLMLFAAFIGLNFPYYVGCLFGGALIRNIADAFHHGTYT